MSWPFGEICLLPWPILSRLHENALEAGSHGAADIGLGIVTNHHDILGAASHAFHGELEKCWRRLAEHSRDLTRSVFEPRDEGTSIEAQLIVMVEEVAIFRKREKLGAMEDLPVGLIQEVVGEEGARIADDDGLAASRR